MEIGTKTAQFPEKEFINGIFGCSAGKEKDITMSLPLRVMLLRRVGLTYGGYRGAGSGKAGRYAGGGGDRTTLHHHHHQQEGKEESRDTAVVGHPYSLSKILYGFLANVVYCFI